MLCFSMYTIIKLKVLRNANKKNPIGITTNGITLMCFDFISSDSLHLSESQYR